MGSPPRSRRACRSGASTASTRRFSGWAVRRSRCHTACPSKRRRFPPARTSSVWRAALLAGRPMAEVNMPKLSDTMEEGTVLEWKKKDGDEVHKGDVLAEVESDKATFDLEAEADGVLKIIVPNGVPAKIGAPIASIGPAGDGAKAAKADGAKPEKPRAEPVEAKAKAEPVEAADTPDAATEPAEAAEAIPAETGAEPPPSAKPAVAVPPVARSNDGAAG